MTSGSMDGLEAYPHSVEKYSALKRKKILTPATLCLSLEDTVPREMSQTKDRCCVVPGAGAPTETECGWRAPGQGWVFNGDRVSVLQDGKSGGDGGAGGVSNSVNVSQLSTDTWF